MFIFFPIACDEKLKLLLYTHCRISIVFSQHGFREIEWDVIILKKIKMPGGEGAWRKTVEGGFSDFSYQVCIVKDVICQLVANQAARFWGCWVFLPHFLLLFPFGR